MGTFIVISFIILFAIIVHFYSKKKKHTDNPKSFENANFEYLSFKNDISTMSISGIRHRLTTNKIEFSFGENVFFIHEPNNKHDHNAIKIISENGFHIGYVPKYTNQEMLKLMSDGYYFSAKVSYISLSEPNFPYASLEIIRSKDSNITPFSKERIEELNKISNDRKEKYIVDHKISFELCQKGLELEKEKNIEEAIKHFEESIKLPNAPPVSYTRLVINYRKKKDYVNEIRVLNLEIEAVNQSKANASIKKENIKEINARIKKAELLLNKNS